MKFLRKKKKHIAHKFIFWKIYPIFEDVKDMVGRSIRNVMVLKNIFMYMHTCMFPLNCLILLHLYDVITGYTTEW